MGRVFVLGAGFSKAVAGLPLASELLCEFRVICEREKQNAAQSNRYQWGVWLGQFVDGLIEQDWTVPFPGEWHGQPVCNVPEAQRLEIILTLIVEGCKGNCDWPAFFRGQLCHSPSEARKHFATYIYMALENGSIQSELIGSFLSKIQPDLDSFITFNYDVVLERALYDANLWSPGDGYRLTIDTHIPLTDRGSTPSRIAVHKPHGSINWKKPQNGRNEFSLLWCFNQHDRSTGRRREIFPGALQSPESEIPGISCAAGEIPNDESSQDANWILPTLSKQYDMEPFKTVRRNALQDLQDAHEVVFIGYSFPSADTESMTIFREAKLCDKRIIIANRDPETQNRVQELFNCECARFYRSLEHYCCPREH